MDEVEQQRAWADFIPHPGRNGGKPKIVTGIGGVVVAKPRRVVTFGLFLRLRISKVSTITGIERL